MLFHLLIVDNEPTIRKGLSHFVPWQALECVVDATACDGQEAVALIQEKPPHIVITDIRMPRMDGIALAKYIYENHPDIRVIMLTGYAEFSYAQSAIQYGVTDFIVKPTSREKLTDAVKKCQELILKEQAAHSEQKLALSHLQEHLLMELTEKAVLTESMQEKLTQAQLELSHFFLSVFCFPTEQFVSFHENYQSMKEMILQKPQIRYCYPYNHQFLILIYEVPEAMTAPPEDLKKYCEEISSVLSSLYQLELTAGISLCQHGLAALHTACTQALAALSLHFYRDSSVSVYQPEAVHADLTVNQEYLLLLYHIETSLNSWDFDGAQSACQKLFAQMRSSFMKADDARNICSHIYYLCSRMMIKKGLLSPPVEVLSAILTCTSVFQLEQQVQSFLHTVKSSMLGNGRPLSPMLEEVIAYIHQHLEENLSLDRIASVVHVHPSHLSRHFKKEKGLSLTEYINQSRIEKAQEYLTFSNLLTYQVAEKTGFHDPAYFSLIFKKYTGLSPKEFRQLHALCKSGEEKGAELFLEEEKEFL